MHAFLKVCCYFPTIVSYLVFCYLSFLLSFLVPCYFSCILSCLVPSYVFCIVSYLFPDYFSCIIFSPSCCYLFASSLVPSYFFPCILSCIVPCYFICLRPVCTGHWMHIQSASMRIGCVHTANVKKPNRIKCASSQSTWWGGLKPDWTGLEWNVVGCGLRYETTCELPLSEWLLGATMSGWRRARTWRRRHCRGSGIENGSIYFVNVVRVACTRQGHAQISFSRFTLVRIEKRDWLCSLDLRNGSN